MSSHETNTSVKHQQSNNHSTSAHARAGQPSRSQYMISTYKSNWATGSASHIMSLSRLCASSSWGKARYNDQSCSFAPAVTPKSFWCLRMSHVIWVQCLSSKSLTLQGWVKAADKWVSSHRTESCIFP